MKTLLFMFVAFFSAASMSLADVQTGAAAPDFTLSDTNGQEHSLAGNKGKFVLLEWINPDCPFVKKHYNSQNMQNLQSKYKELGVAWFSINSSSEGKEGHYPADQLNNWIKEQGSNVTAMLLDTDGTVGRLYGAKTTPHMFIIDPQGILIYQGAIDSVASADTGDIPKSENYVQKALDKALAGEPVELSSTKAYGCSVKY